MKKIFSITMLMGAALLFAGCSSEEDDIFSHSAAERLNEASEVYTKKLAASPAGWLMEYYPTNSTFAYSGRGYLLADDFNADGSVTVGMKNIFSGNQYRESTSAWQVITDDGPVLSFNSYNANMHIFSTPEDMRTLAPGISPTNAEQDATGQGVGVGGDYEFIITDAPDDGSYIMLKGKKRGTYTRLTPIPEGVALQDYINDIQNFDSTIFVDGAPNPNYMTLGSRPMQLDSAFTGIMRIFPQGADAISTQTLHPFLFSKRDGSYYLRFRDAITISGDSTVQEFRYDSVAGEFVSNYDNTRITGYPRAEFLTYAVANRHRWSLNANSTMSPKMKVKMDSLVADFRSRTASGRRMNFRNFQLTRGNDSTYIWRLNFSTSGDSHRDYNFTLNVTGSDVNVTYTGPADQSAETVYTQMVTVQRMIEAMSGDFSIVAPISNFNLTRMRFVSKADADLWFDVTYQR